MFSQLEAIFFNVVACFSGQTHYIAFAVKWREGVKRLTGTFVLCCRVSGKDI